MRLGLSLFLLFPMNKWDLNYSQSFGCMIEYFHLNLGECMCVYTFEYVGIISFIIADLSCLQGRTYFLQQS